MPRAKVNRTLPDAERIRLFAEYHIEKVRFAKGGIAAVKHTQWGWISPEQYYRLQKVHEFMPLVEKAIEGGYRVNAMIWGFNPTIGVFGIDIPVPAGAALLATSVYNLSLEIGAAKAGAPHWPRLLELGWQVFGPFGAVLSLMEQITNALGAQAAEIDAAAFAVFKGLAQTELAYEAKYGAESVAAVQQLEQLLANGKARHAAWADDYVTWRDVKL